MSPVVVLFALEREVAPFRRLMGRDGTPDLVHCGVGPASAGRALDALLPSRPGLVLLAGFSGALAPDLGVGRLVVADAVLGPDGATYPVTHPLTVPGAIAGPIVATERIVGTAAAKRELFARTKALAVDMESATVARRCAEVGVPFACLRVISDDAANDLPPELDGIFADGRPRVGRVLVAVCRRPGLLWQLLALRRATRRAAEALAQGLRQALSAPRPGLGLPAGG